MTESEPRMCRGCGRPSTGFATVLMANLSGDSYIICAYCAAREHAQTFSSIEEADEFIADCTASLAKLENHLSEVPEEPQVPESMKSIAMTPLSVYRTLQIHLAEFKIRRAEMLIEMDNPTRRQYEIKKAIAAEDYERAAKLRDGEQAK